MPSISCTAASSVENHADRIGTNNAAGSSSYPSCSAEEGAEMLAQEAVELIPGDPRPWQVLAEACDAQGARGKNDG